MASEPLNPDEDPGLDAFIATVMRAITLADLRHDTWLYRDVMAEFDPANRAQIVAAEERHVARERGW